MTKQEAVKILQENLVNKNMIKHCLASGAVMRALAERLFPDSDRELAEAWELAGLLHDADAEKTSAEKQGALVGEWFLAGGKYEGQMDNKYQREIIQAMRAHNEMTGAECQSPMDWALYASEKLTGLIVATALVLPEKKLAKVDAPMVMRRFKEKSFAKGAKRENIRQGTRLGLELAEFVAICLSAMQGISDELGL